MATIAVSGITNLEMSGRVAGFPLELGDGVGGGSVEWVVAGVGWNIAHALAMLGHRIRLLTPLAEDALSGVIRNEIAGFGGVTVVATPTPETPRSLSLVASDGSRIVISDRRQADHLPIPEHVARPVLTGCDFAVLTHMNVNRPLFAIAHELGVPTSVDLHVVHDLADEHDADFIRNATLVFMSAASFPAAAAECLVQLRAQAMHAASLTCGMGEDEAMTLERNGSIPIVARAVAPHGVVDTTGAGDALHAGFVDGFVRGLPTDVTLRRAVYTAGFKVAVRGASAGHISLAELDAAFS